MAGDVKVCSCLIVATSPTEPLTGHMLINLEYKVTVSSRLLLSPPGVCLGKDSLTGSGRMDGFGWISFGLLAFTSFNI